MLSTDAYEIHNSSVLIIVDAGRAGGLASCGEEPVVSRVLPRRLVTKPYGYHEQRLKHSARYSYRLSDLADLVNPQRSTVSPPPSLPNTPQNQHRTHL